MSERTVRELEEALEIANADYELLQADYKQLIFERERKEEAWLIENGENSPKYRTWRDGCPTWTTDPYEATWYCRRIDAERASAEDEGAWRIVEHEFNDA